MMSTVHFFNYVSSKFISSPFARRRKKNLRFFLFPSGPLIRKLMINPMDINQFRLFVIIKLQVFFFFFFSRVVVRGPKLSFYSKNFNMK